MKILMPKEMKIRLVANVLGILIAFLNAGYSAWYLVTLGEATTIIVLFPILSVAAAGLYFLMAKIMWALQKKTKMLGWAVLVAVGVLGIVGPLVVFLEASETVVDVGPAGGWSFGVAALSGCGGFFIVAGKLIGEMVEKLKFLAYVGFACIAGLVVLLVLFGTLETTGDAHVIAAAIGSFAMTLGGLAVTILGYWAESVLIKKKFLVYN
ncbi:MAG: hypothetical protein JW839_00780 [Candidatus Lokiarchaeota archaeon]|nr:hypothetical protein [Candidatus Lokiarchaeota archaeon]